ncbi:hypothetical protein KKF04_06450, partial [Patescibacteria group bacterium]|nr:hypothetical protein [Patescibacteria group bacterium]
MKFKFIKYTKVWFAFSIIAVLISIGAMVYNKTTYGNALELGIDFTGGSLMEFQFESETDSSSLYEVIEAAYPDSVSQITATGEGTYIVHAKDMTEEQLDSVNASVSESLGGFEMLRFTTIGPKIGDTLKRKAIIALSVALIAIVLYIAYAFRKVPKRVSPWKFGLCAIVALAHDVLITLGIFALLRFEID